LGEKEIAMKCKALLWVCVALAVAGLISTGCNDKEDDSDTKGGRQKAKDADGRGEDPKPTPVGTIPPTPPIPVPVGPITERVKTLWADVKVGDACTYRSLNNSVIVCEATAVDAEVVTMRMSISMEGETTSVTEKTMPRYGHAGLLPDVDPAAAVSEKGSETIDVGGELLACKVFQVVTGSAEKPVTEVRWVCDQVPGGLVKLTNNVVGIPQVIMQLLEYKRAP